MTTGQRNKPHVVMLLDKQRIWTRAEIAEFYDDVRRGIYRNEELDKLRIERAIILATKEGRVK